MKHLHYGWVMVILGSLFLMLHAIVIFTFGIFLIPLTAEFGWDRAEVSLAFSIFCLIIGILAVFAGRLTDKYGPRLLITINGILVGTGLVLMSQVSSLWQAYLIWGLLIGVGTSGAIIPATSPIPRWFVKKRGIAIGITWAGLGIGQVIWPPITQWLISSYGWQQSYIILGLITFISVIPLAQFMRHSPQRMSLKPYGEDETIKDINLPPSAREGLSFRQAITTGRFWVMGIMQFCFYFYVQIVIVHLAPLAIDIGISAITAASILSILGVISIIGRLSIGFISERVGDRLALIACYILAIIALIWLLFAQTTWMFYVFSVVFGFAWGGTVPIQTVVPAKLFGLKSLGIILGTFWLFSMISSALGAPLAGRIFDVTGSYSLAILICIAVCAVGIIFSLSLLRNKVKVEVAV